QADPGRRATAWEAAGRPATGKRPGEGDVVATSKSRGPIVRYRSYTPGIRISPENVGPARQQLGEFDSSILCAECDGILGRFDDYVIELCQKFEQLHTKHQPDAFELPQADRELFAKFVLSVLWRASISKRPSVAVVKLGPY